MKKSNKIIAVGLLVFVLTLVIVPSVLKKKVTKLMVAEIENNSDYQVKYESVEVSFFRNFPRVKVDVKSFLLQSPTETVLDVANFKAELSFAKIIKNQLELTSAELQTPKFNYTKVAINEKSATAATSTSNATSADAEEKSTPVLSSFAVKSFIISDGQIHYHTNDSLNLVLSGIDLQVAGHLDIDEIVMKAQLSVASLDYKTSGFSIKAIPLSFDGEMLYTIASQHLAFKDNHLKFDDFTTSLLGEVHFQDAPEFDITFDAPKTSIKSALALLPHSLITDVEQLETYGDVSLNGFVKGKYTDAQSWPAFGLDFKVANAWFKYAHLSEKVEGINVLAQVSHPVGTAPDSTIISINKMSLHSGNNNISGQLNITNPASDVTVSGHLKSVLNLATLKKAIPMRSSDIVGSIDADISFDGRLAAIEQEQYQDFDAAGHLTLRDYFVKNKNIPQGLRINNATMQFTPERINIKSFSGKLGSSDLRLSGYLSNYFSYLFDDNTLNGELKLSSTKINLNEFLDYEAPTVQKTQVASTVPTPKKEKGPFIVPSSLNIVFNSAVDQMQVDDLFLRQFKGKITVKEAKILLDNLNFKTLDGSVNANGQYNTQNAKAVYSDMDLKLKNIDIAKATTSISALRKMLPITQTTQGKVSSEMHYYAQMDAKGDVNPQSIKSNGYISSPGLRIANNSSLNSLAKQLKDARYKDITTGPVKIDYKMDKGLITLAPFDVKMVDKNINAGGWYSLENTLDFNIKTTVKAKEIGGDISKYIGMVSDVNKPLPVTINLSGDAKKPTVKYDTREAINILRKDVSKNLNKDAINSILKSLF